jgi:DNA-formamidopyrimidine glycosylase
MPELVEVETARRVLAPQLRGCTIEDIEVRLAKSIKNYSSEEFKKLVIGSKFSTILRRGKFLIFNMITPKSVDAPEELKLVAHYRMTGVLLVTPPDYEDLKHTHIVFKLRDENGAEKELRYIDQRQFGGMWAITTGAEFRETGIGQLGAEATDETLTGEYLKEHLQRRKSAIKTGLLDQSVIAGLGNIYTDEVLYRCGIIPTRACSSLTDREWQVLASEIPKMMEFMIDKNQISEEDYLAGKGTDYRNTPFLQVYNHAGEVCPKCGSELERTVVAGRSSVYCSHCQK